MPGVFAGSRFSGRARFRVGSGGMDLEIGRDLAIIGFITYFETHEAHLALVRNASQQGNNDVLGFTLRQQAHLVARGRILSQLC